MAKILTVAAKSVTGFDRPNMIKACKCRYVNSWHFLCLPFLYMAAVRGAPLRAPGSLILGLSTRVQLPPNLFDSE